MINHAQRQAAIGLIVAAIGVIEASACSVTTYPNCSAYFPNEIFNCFSPPNNGVDRITYSGGGTYSRCDDNGPTGTGALGCMDLPLQSCTYTMTVLWCDGTVQSQNITSDVQPTQDNGLGPCPPVGG